MSIGMSSKSGSHPEWFDAKNITPMNIKKSAHKGRKIAVANASLALLM